MGADYNTRFTELKAKGRLPSIKGVALSVLEASLAEDMSLSRMAQIITPDAALTGRLIKVSNSALYPGSRPVASLQDAMSKLGMSVVRQTALGFALVSDNRDESCEAFDYPSYWARSIIRGSLMRQACLMFKLGSADEMFTLGLLSKIGELALVTAYPDKYAPLLDSGLEGRALRDKESEMFGIDAPAMSAAIMEDWKLPAPFAMAATMESDYRGSAAPRIKELYALISGAETVAQGWVGLQEATPDERIAQLAPPTLQMVREALSAAGSGRAEPTSAEIAELAKASFEEALGWLESLAILPNLKAPRARRPAHPVHALEISAAGAPKRPLADRLLESDSTVEEIRALVGSTDASSIKTIAQALAIRGGQIRALRSKGQLFDELLGFAPHVLFLDFDASPKFATLLQTIKETERGRELLVVLVARSDQEHLAGALLARGADDFMIRPFNLSQASAKVATAEKIASITGALRASKEDLKRYALDMESVNKRLEKTSLYDALTNLPNRELLNDRLNLAVGELGPEGKQVALVMMALDNFKGVNDSHGQPAVDGALKEVASRLKSMLRAGDSLARMAGDEFAVVLRDVESDQQAVDFAILLLERAAQPTAVRDLDMRAGVALHPEHGASAEALIKNAGLALQQAKQAAKGTVQVYTPDLSDAVNKRFFIEAALGAALERGELALLFQPRVDLGTGRMVGAEALLRWHHPEMGMIPPDVFIPIAEETGAIEKIGQWVMREALRQTKPLLLEDRSFRVAVNISARQFKSKTLAAEVAATLRAEGFPGCNLEVEISEAAAMDDIFHAAKSLEELKSLGLAVSIDDLGTGYSSLSHLKRMPFDALKIDKSFMLNALVDKDGNAICHMIAALSKAMGKGLVAEGIETAALADFSQRLGAKWGQGFLYSKAVPSAELRALLSKSW